MNQLIDKELVSEIRFDFEPNITYTLNISPIFSPLIQLWIHLSIYPNYFSDVNYFLNGEIITHGDGQFRQFYASVIEELGSFFEVAPTGTVYPLKVNEKFNKLTSQELFLFGKTINYLRQIVDFDFTFRFPFWFLVQLFSQTHLESPPNRKRKLDNECVEIPKITDEELIYFADLQNCEATKNILKYRNNHQGFAKLETGQLTWRCALLDSLGWNNRLPKEKIKCISDGFKTFDSETGILNLASIDYYFSGEIFFDRESFLKNIIVLQSHSPQHETSVSGLCKKLKNTIEKMDNNQLEILAENISGFKLEALNKNIHIYLVPKFDNNGNENTKIRIRTCSSSIDIPANLLKNNFNEIVASLCGSDRCFNDE